MKFSARSCSALRWMLYLTFPLWCADTILSADFASGQQPGSVLFFPVYTSSSTTPQLQNTRFSLTNVEETTAANIHLFFVDGVTGAASDSWICVTANQTVSFLASDVDPGVNGYVVAVATDGRGCPLNFNHLVGEASVKFVSGHAANLAAVAVAALTNQPSCDGATATLRFDGMSYGVLPRVLALSNFPSRADGNDTFVLVDRIGGDLTSRAATVGNLFGVLYDDAGIPFGLPRGVNAPQLRINLRSQFPFQPRLEQIIPAGRSGWLKLFHFTQDIALLGVSFTLNTNPERGIFTQGHNLHALSLTNSATLTIPILPPAC